MCTLAGYTGTKDAAPILLEMSKRQEGIWAGYYAGLTTLSEGDLFLEKVIGDTRKLEREIDAAAFRGTLGIAHSRTKSGGDREWGQPFTDASQTVACAGQGHAGIFKDNEARNELADELSAAGVAFRTAIPEPVGGYPMLSNGHSIHATELVCAAVASEYRACGDPVEAIIKIAADIPAEAIYLSLFRDEPEKIFICNLNQRLAIAQDDEGAYLATSSLAFPGHITEWSEMPANAVAIVSPDMVEFISHIPEPELQVHGDLPSGLDEAFLGIVNAQPGQTLGFVMKEAFTELFPRNTLIRMTLAGYQAMEQLLQEGRIRTETKMVPGVNPQENIPETILFAD